MTDTQARVLIERVAARETAKGGQVRALVRIGDERRDIWFRVRGAEVSGTANAFLAAALVPAMVRGWPLYISSASISRRLVSSLPHIQKILKSWWPQLHEVTVQSDVISVRKPTGARSATFFSGGVDSFYTLLTRRALIDRLVFVRGFDIRRRQAALWKRALLSAKQVANKVETPLIVVDTNVRDFLDEWAHWEFAHGVALASVAYSIAPTLHTIMIPASHSFADQFPWGSHPMLDPLWAIEGLNVLHAGSEANRAERVAAISDWQLALDHLRVCWLNPKGAYNCGRCEKCLRTMISLHAAGALGRSKTLPNRLPRAQLRRLDFGALGIVAHGLENIQALGAIQGNEWIIESIRRAINTYAATDELWRGAFWNSFQFGGTYADRRRTRRR